MSKNLIISWSIFHELLDTMERDQLTVDTLTQLDTFSRLDIITAIIKSCCNRGYEFTVLHDNLYSELEDAVSRYQQEVGRGKTSDLERINDSAVRDYVIKLNNILGPVVRRLSKLLDGIRVRNLNIRYSDSAILLEG